MIPLNSVWHKPNTEHCYHRTQMLMSMTIRGNITKSCGKGRAQCLKYMVYKVIIVLQPAGISRTYFLFTLYYIFHIIQKNVHAWHATIFPQLKEMLQEPSESRHHKPTLQVQRYLTHTHTTKRTSANEWRARTQHNLCFRGAATRIE